MTLNEVILIYYVIDCQVSGDNGDWEIEIMKRLKIHIKMKIAIALTFQMYHNNQYQTPNIHLGLEFFS